MTFYNPAIQRYLQQFSEMFHGENWVDLNIYALLILPYETAVHKRMEGKHTIFQIVNHSLVWRELLLKRLQGDKEFNIVQNDAADWNLKEEISEGDWRQLTTAFKLNQKEILLNLKDQPDGLLAQIVPGRAYNFDCLINGIIFHDYYHFGQVAMLK